MDMEISKVLSGFLEHNHDRKIEHKVLRAYVKKKAAEDITARPSKIIN